MMHMLWVRRFFVQIFSSLFILSLLLLGFAVSITSTLSKPATVESWLSESKLYDHFIDNVISQSEKSVSKEQGNGGGGISLDNPGVQAAAKEAFSADLIESSVNTIIDSNYDWLEGITPAPNFSVNLAGAKQTFAVQVGTYVQTTLLSLPQCTAAQLQQLPADIDPLQLTCLPPNINPSAEAQKIEQEIGNSKDFLGDPILTASSINPDGEGAQPYYVKLAKAPQIYQLAKKVPLALGAVAIICALLIFFVSLTRRKGIRRLGWALLFSGVVLLATKFAADFAFDKFKGQAFNENHVGALQQSLTNALGKAEDGILGVTLLFGIAYAATGLLILIVILATRGRKPKTPRHQPVDEPEEATPFDREMAEQEAKASKRPLVTDIAPKPRTTPSGPPPVKPGVQPRKKQKLIQL